MNIYTIVGALGALVLLAVIVAVLEHLDRRARERRWQQALASFNMDDGRTALTDPPMGVKRTKVVTR